MGVIRVGVKRPTDLSNLYGWWDATDFQGLANGTTINTWSDKSGSGFDFNFSTVSGTKQVGNNGYSVIQGGRYKTTGLNLGTSTLSAFTIFIVVKAFATNNNAIFGCAQDIVTFGAAGSNQFVFWPGSINGKNVDTVLYHRFTARLSTVASQRLYRLDEVSYIAGSTPSNINDIWLNERPSGLGFGANTFAEIVLYNRALSAQEVGQIERYLQFKWSL